MATPSDATPGTGQSGLLAGATALTAARDAWQDAPGHGVGGAAAERLQAMGADETTCTAALLGDPALAELSSEAIEARYGAVIANLVKHLRWLNSLDISQGAPGAAQAERIRRMVLAMVDDVRAVLIKLAYRLYRLQHLARESYETRRAVARETLDIYTPLANRLGLARLKWEMEDLAFRYLDPQAYKSLARALEEKREQRERYVQDFVAELGQALAAADLPGAEVSGRPKHIYSIWRKMQSKQLAFGELFDVRAVRVLVGNVSECYTALGVVHSRWRHIPSEFDDYIANPKRNGYQSLHTAIVGPGGKSVEVQIRSRDMHEYAEHGVAAHWLYKEGGAGDRALQRTVSELRALLDDAADEALLENFSSDFYSDRVFVFTPTGEVVDLPKGATPLDFAYQIHTQIGHRCRGAKVNGQIVTLRTVLGNGDRVEILTTKVPKPSRDWLNRDLGYLVSPRSRAKVRQWFNQQAHSHHVEEGRLLLERELRRLASRSLNPELLCRHFDRERLADLYAAIGKHEITAGQIAQAVEALVAPPAPPEEAEPARLETRRARPKAGGDVVVRGVGNLLVDYARCCNPVPFDPIVGFITRGRGVKVHRADCRNILRSVERGSERLIEVDWGEDSSDYYTAAVRVLAHDRRGLLSDVAAVVSGEGVAITAAHSDTDKKRHLATLHLKVEVRDYEQLSRMLEKISQVRNVLEVERESA